MATGNTAQFIEQRGGEVQRVESLTGFPEILGGRVKTLHPAIFAGILSRIDHPTDRDECETHRIAAIDLIVVDLYPFEATAAKADVTEAELIEQIDIGGVALLRAGAKNFHRVAVVAGFDAIPDFLRTSKSQKGTTTLEQRRNYAVRSFNLASNYDARISRALGSGDLPAQEPTDFSRPVPLKYGENPHQRATFYGDPEAWFQNLTQNPISYNNFLDLEVACQIVDEFFPDPCFVIVKHGNPCGVALGKDPQDAIRKALACNPEASFGGVLITNAKIDLPTGHDLHTHFFAALLAREYDQKALELLKKRGSRLLLKRVGFAKAVAIGRSCFGGTLAQEVDALPIKGEGFTLKTRCAGDAGTVKDMEFAMRVVRRSLSNAVALCRRGQLVGIGAGQTSRIEALRQAIRNAESSGLGSRGTVLASDGFFPFDDSVKLAHAHGIAGIVQPGGSRNDSSVIESSDQVGIPMYFSGTRHFRH